MISHKKMAEYLRGEIEALRVAEAEALQAYTAAQKRWQQVRNDLQAVTGVLEFVEGNIGAAPAASQSTEKE